MPNKQGNSARFLKKTMFDFLRKFVMISTYHSARTAADMLKIFVGNYWRKICDTLEEFLGKVSAEFLEIFFESFKQNIWRYSCKVNWKISAEMQDKLFYNISMLQGKFLPITSKFPKRCFFFRITRDRH